MLDKRIGDPADEVIVHALIEKQAPLRTQEAGACRTRAPPGFFHCSAQNALVTLTKNFSLAMSCLEVPLLRL